MILFVIESASVVAKVTEFSILINCINLRSVSFNISLKSQTKNSQKIPAKKLRKLPPSHSHHPMEPTQPEPSNTRPYTIGVFIASTVIAIFILCHFLRILWKKFKKSITENDEIELESNSLTVKSREDMRKLSSSCVKNLHQEMLKNLKVDDVNCIQFDLEKCDKLQPRFDERRQRTQSTRVKSDRVKNERERRFGQTMKPVRNKTEGVAFFAGCSHRYIEDV